MTVSALMDASLKSGAFIARSSSSTGASCTRSASATPKSTKTVDPGVGCAEARRGTKTAAAKITSQRARCTYCTDTTLLEFSAVIGCLVAPDRVPVHDALVDDAALDGHLDPHPRPVDAHVRTLGRQVRHTRIADVRLV